MNEWTPAKQQEHRQELMDALDDIAWDPDWPAQAVALVPEESGPRLRIGYGWSSLVYT